jgi:hypothetical protein
MRKTSAAAKVCIKVERASFRIAIIKPKTPNTPAIIRTIAQPYTNTVFENAVFDAGFGSGFSLFIGGTAAGASVLTGGSTGLVLFEEASTAVGGSANASIIKGLEHLGHLACLPMLVSLTLNFDLQFGHCVFIA